MKASTIQCCSLFAQATASDVTSNNLASASKIIIIECEALDTPAYIEMTQMRNTMVERVTMTI